MPPRLLAGLLPHVLLERYVFWQDEKDFLRGYPKDPTKCRDIVFVNLGVGGHVAIHGGRFEQVRFRLTPSDSLWLPLIPSDSF